MKVEQRTVSERTLLMVLAAMHFTNLMDFVIMMPLGPQLMRAFNIGPYEFGVLVSSYTFAASVTGLLGIVLLDRFDRKKALLFIYTGFLLGTLLCALAPTVMWLGAGRVVAGMFGGMMSAVILAMIGDAVPPERRGRAMGVLMASFSAATIAGVPAGLYLAGKFNWQAPFFLLSGMGVFLLALGFFALPTFRAHLEEDFGHAGRRFASIILKPDHLRAYAMMLFLIISGFTVVPYIAPYLVSNAGFPETSLALVYFIGGACTILSARMIGKAADKYGKYPVFRGITLLATIPILAVTNLPSAHIAVVLIVTTVFMIFVSGRFVPAMALITSAAEARDRGAFMSMVTSVQNLGSGLASFVSGIILTKQASGRLLHYDWIGVISTAAAMIAILLAARIRPARTG